MQRFMVLALALCVTLGACRRSSTDKDLQAKSDSREQPGAASAEKADLGDLVIAAPVRYQNLAIFPVLSKVPKNEDRYITLEEGLKAGTVEIFEVGADGVRIDEDDEAAEPETETDLREALESLQEVWPQGDAEEPGQQPDEAQPTEQDPFDDEPSSQQDGQGEPLDVQIVEFPAPQEVDGEVNRLMVLNTSGRPLYLMPGEVIYGGKQDRTIGEETIILASDKPQPIDVYCVEHGRWSGRAAADSADALVLLSDGLMNEATAKKLAAEANRGKFVASAGNLSTKSRLAVQAGKGPQAQGEVWRAVASTIAAAEVEAPSGTFTANYATPEVVDQLKPYIEKLQAPVAGEKQVVGAIVAINGKVESVDVFGSTPLFKKLWPKLLKSHALDAANLGREAGAEKVCTLKDAEAFLTSAMQADVQEKTEAKGGLVVTRRESQGVVFFATASGAAPAEEAGGFGGVHMSAFAK